MKYPVLSLIILFLVTSCVNNTLVQRPHITGNIKNDVTNLLPEGKFDAEIMDGVYETPRQKELMRLFNEGIKNNFEWYLKYIKTIPDNQCRTTQIWE